MKNRKQAYIFDIDGTVADSEMRHIYKENIARGDWTWFTERIPYFETIQANVDMLKALKKKYTIIFITVRSDVDRAATIKWLKRYNMYDGELYMRPDKSKKLKDYEEKEIHLKELLKTHEIIGAMDDNSECLQMFRRYGIPTLHFAKGLKENDCDPHKQQHSNT